MNWASWVIVSPILFIGLVGHILTLAIGISMIRQCLATHTYQRRSGLPLVGSVFFIIAFAFARLPILLWLAGLMLTIEILLGVIASVVLRKTKAAPRPREPVAKSGSTARQ